jgi:hypothetical protein
MVSIIGDRAGQLGEMGEYWMGRKESCLIWRTWHMKSSNWVAPCAAEMKAIIPYLTCVQWDSAWATHSVSTKAYVWKTCTRVRWALIVSLATSWIVATCCALLSCVCRVVRFIPLQCWLLIQISVTLSDISDGLFAKSNCRIINFIILWW